jgi:hypothetical protein
LSADFGKIKIGDTRVDIWGGHQQYVVNFMRAKEQKTVSSTSGVARDLTPWEVGLDFVVGKTAPVPKFGAYSAGFDEDVGGEFHELPEAVKLGIPLGFQNFYDGLKQSPGAAGASLALGTVGLSAQTYGTDEVKAKRAQKQAALAARGPAHVRDHEDRMQKLTDAAKAAGLPTSDPDVQVAVQSSRRIRDLEMQLKRARKKKGDDLTYEERARIVGRLALRVFPQYKAEIQAELATKEWERVYKMLRHEIRAPYESAVG